jgi:hypothetical protein
MTKNIYCTLDTETFGGASKPKGIYHLAGLIHDRQGNILATFNYLIMEHYNEIQTDSYAKKNFYRYQNYVANGITTAIPTEQDAINNVKALYNYYSVKYSMAFNTGFDFCKTKCKELLEISEFIDIWLMALETLAQQKKYQRFCLQNDCLSQSKKTCSTTAETFYRYLTGNTDFLEEHTAFEDSKIEMIIFLECLKKHTKFTKNCHCFDYEKRFKLFSQLALNK